MCVCVGGCVCVAGGQVEQVACAALDRAEGRCQGICPRGHVDTWPRTKMVTMMSSCSTGEK